MDFGVENPYRELNLLVNSLILPKTLIDQVQNHSGLDTNSSYYLISYLRDLIAGTCVYWITAGVWHITIYYILGDRLFKSKGRPYPTTATILDQILLAQSSIFIYASLPILSEFLIENGYTRAYFYLSDVGGFQFYLLYLALYVVFFEVGIYWMHRTLHTNKFLYKYVHALHHKYNKHETLTPWASIAFNPLDGMLQAAPYVIGLFFIPVHYLAHVFLLFFSGVWATCIHDSVVSLLRFPLHFFLTPPQPASTEPIMGAAYHTIHHTHYHYNFGQVTPPPLSPLRFLIPRQWFIFCDYIFGSLRSPADMEKLKEK
jgi:Delta7-sterol 5-desaturase